MQDINGRCQSKEEKVSQVVEWTNRVGALAGHVLESQAALKARLAPVLREPSVTATSAGKEAGREPLVNHAERLQNIGVMLEEALRQNNVMLDTLEL